MHGRYTVTDATGAVKNVNGIAMPSPWMSCVYVAWALSTAQVRGINLQQLVESKTLNSYSYLCSGQVIIPKHPEENAVPTP